MVATFIEKLYLMYQNLYFTYLEVNPLVVTNESIYILDLAAKLDATADFVCRAAWGEIEYPPPFGRDAFPEEAYIADLDAKSGASLKVANNNVQDYVQKPKFNIMSVINVKGSYRWINSVSSTDLQLPRKVSPVACTQQCSHTKL